MKNKGEDIMEKDYVLDHDWGDYNSEDTINKLMLRNIDDFMKYFDKEIQNQFVATMIEKYVFKFEDGLVIRFTPEIMR